MIQVSLPLFFSIVFKECTIGNVGEPVDWRTEWLMMLIWKPGKAVEVEGSASRFITAEIDTFLVGTAVLGNARRQIIQNLKHQPIQIVRQRH